MTAKSATETQNAVLSSPIPFGIYFEEYISEEEINSMATTTRDMCDDDTGTTNRSTEDNDT